MAKKKTGFKKGTYKKGEKPSDYAGGWENNLLTAEQLREKAWHRESMSKRSKK
ncbi:hypothetical protein Q0590_35790 [Rhodocytophaga aerolata]|uniref:Uncharacterized protein n=1 Tax=Rhodocytophaga aerolata TaxID=455078 RepID=A0ABT8RIY6_9BACT|nr:hypothetical protein [Rhodocytophaga aerolata]MDO1451691.1 hypothetical protein [Rhodocytophaga aerolata]